jgi:hypothetical protein
MEEWRYFHVFYGMGCCTRDTSGSYSGGVRFETRMRQRLHRLKLFTVFCSPSRKSPGYLDIATIASFQIPSNPMPHRLATESVVFYHKIHTILISTLHGGEWSVSLPGRSNPGERLLGTHYVESWVGPRIRGGPISPWLYKENNKLRDWKKCIYCTFSPWAPHTYDFVVLTSLTHPRKILVVVLQIGK